MVAAGGVTAIRSRRAWGGGRSRAGNKSLSSDLSPYLVGVTFTVAPVPTT